MGSARSTWIDVATPGPVKPGLARQAVFVLCAAIFAADLFEPSLYALATLYAIPVLISTWVRSRRVTRRTAAVCLVLALATPLASVALGLPEVQPLWMVLVNRAAAAFTIAVVASLGLLQLQVEERLASTREAAVTTLRSIADAVITIDTGGRVTFFNPVAESLTGVPADEAAGQNLERVFHVVERGPSRPPIEELRGAQVDEGTLVARDGRRRRIEERRSPLRDGTGSIAGWALVFRDVTQLKEREDAMRRLAYRDELTGLPNRVSLLDRLSLEFAHAQRSRARLGLLYLDLDGFKEVNDELGHHAGDQFLRAVATRLRGSLRAGDTVARLGGDEFVVVLPGLGSADEARAVGQKVLDALSAPLEIEGRVVRPGASIGVAVHPDDADEAETLLRRADKAMYRAKQLGGRRIETCVPVAGEVSNEAR